MADVTEQLTGEVARYRAASTRLADALGRQDGVIAVGLRTVPDHGMLDAHMRTAGSAELRRDVSDRLREFESARRDLRVALTAVLLAQGRSGVEVAELFGVSRQAASRLVIAARRRTDAPMPDGPPGPPGM